MDIKNEDEKVIWSRLVWYSQNIPKHAFILWLAVNNKLLTQDKIRKWGSYDLMVCSLCNKDMDSHSHLFFKCEYSEQLWKKVYQRLDIDCGDMEWDDIVIDLAGRFNGNSIRSIIRRLSLAACVYLIWQERNQRIFRDEHRSWDELFEVFWETIRLRLMSFKTKKSIAVLKVQKEWSVRFNMVDNDRKSMSQDEYGDGGILKSSIAPC